MFTSWDDDEPIKHDKTAIRYITWGREKCPKTNRRHYQGFVIFNRTHRIPSAKRLLGTRDGTHFESIRGTRDEARQYCHKDGDIYEWGKFDGFTKEQLFKEPIDFLKKEYPEFYCRYHRGLEKLAFGDKGKEWRDITVTVLWGDEGVGKSRKARDCESWYVCEEPYKWFDGYQGEKRLILDDYEWGGINFSRLKRLLDGYQMMLETKGGHTWAKWEEVYITTNEDAREWTSYKGMKRRLTHIVNVTM